MKTTFGFKFITLLLIPLSSKLKRNKKKYKNKNKLQTKKTPYTILKTSISFQTQNKKTQKISTG